MTPQHPQTSREHLKEVSAQRRRSLGGRVAIWTLAAVGMLVAALCALWVAGVLLMAGVFILLGQVESEDRSAEAAWIQEQSDAYPFEGMSSDEISGLIHARFVLSNGVDDWSSLVPAPNPDCTGTSSGCESRISEYDIRVLRNSSVPVSPPEDKSGSWGDYYYSLTRDGARVEFELLVKQPGSIRRASDIQCDILFNESGPGDLSCTQLTPWRSVSSEYWREA